MSDAPKWDDTDEVGDAPNFDDTTPVSFEDTEEIAPEESKPSVGDSAIHGLASGASMGFVDDLAGGLEAVGSKVGLRGVGGKSISDIRLETDEEDKQNFMDVYRQARDAKRKEYAESRKENPGTFLTTELGGGLLTSAALPALSAAKGAAATNIMGKAALQGGISGLGFSEADNASDLIADTNKGALTGGALGGLGTLLGKGAQKLIGGGAKLTSKAMGRGSDVIEPYVARPGKYNNPGLTFERVAERVNRPLQKLQGQIDDLGTGAKSADDLARQAADNFKHSLKSEAVPDEALAGVQDLLRKQRSTTSDLASQQKDMLKGSEQNVSMSKLISNLRKQIKGRKVEGVSLPGDKDAKVMQEQLDLLQTLRDRRLDAERARVASRASRGDFGPVQKLTEDATNKLRAEGNKVKPESLMRVRQQIDQNIESAYQNPLGGYTGKGERVAKGVRNDINGILDKQLPESEAYKALRGKLAGETQLANSASDAFGGDNLRGVLAGLSNPNKKDALSTLQNLDTKHSGGVMEALAPFFNAKKLLGNKPALGEAISALPESQQARAAQQALEAAQSTQAPFKGLTPKSTENTMRQLMFASSKKPALEANRAMSELEKHAGKPLKQLIQDLKVKEAFGGGGPQGSRLVNMGRSVGRAVGGKFGEAVGGAAGLTADYGTGKIAKAALDTYIAVKDPVARAAGAAARAAITPVVDALTDRPEGAKYMAVLDRASERGPQAMMVAHQTLLKDPAYKQLVTTTPEDVK